MSVNGLKNMVSVPGWPHVADGVFYQLAAQRAEPKSLPNLKNQPVLPKPNRLRAGSDFNLTTKTGARFSSPNLVLYANLAKTDQPKIGFIVNRSVGGSVTRHLVSRKLRHNFANQIHLLPKNLMIVVRVLKSQTDYTAELNQLIEKALLKFSGQNNKADP
jgi:ribonuclease P protein component